jgi:4-amino-4-deoxy-L-arabinose transferase-like glycosyltransferase
MQPFAEQFRPVPSRTFLTGRLLAIILLAWLSLFTWANSIPINAHEAYVLQTAREMAANGDWIVPYFNGEPRLKKPPINYWMTLATAKLDPFSADVEPWHGRMCSMLGGLFMLLLTAYMGNRLYGGQVGFLAAVLLFGTKGFIDYSLYARPDFLYAAICAAQLFAWIAAWRAEDDSSSQRLCAALAWLCAALATLTKGPHVPAIFLAGFLLFLFAGGERQRILKVLRPFSGVVILLVLCLPWWLLLQDRLVKMDIDIGETQLSGSLLTSLANWKEILSLYYVQRMLVSLLPVSLALPLLIYLNRKNLRRPGDFERLLLYTGAITLIVFTVAGHYRPHYILPLLPFSALLVVFVADRTPDNWFPENIWWGLFWLEAAALAIWPVMLICRQQYVAGLFLAGIDLLLILLLWRELRETCWQTHPFTSKLSACCLLAMLLYAGYNPSWSFRDNGRAEVRDFAIAAGQMVRADDMMVSIGGVPGIMPFYARHSISRIREPDELRKDFAQKGNGQDYYLFIPQDQLAAAKEVFELSPLLTATGEQLPGKTMVFAKVLQMRR